MVRSSKPSTWPSCPFRRMPDKKPSPSISMSLNKPPTVDVDCQHQIGGRRGRDQIGKRESGRAATCARERPGDEATTSARGGENSRRRRPVLAQISRGRRREEVEEESRLGHAGRRGKFLDRAGRGVAGARGGIRSRIRMRKYTRAAPRDGNLRILASHFGKLLEIDFCLFCQILKDGK